MSDVRFIPTHWCVLGGKHHFFIDRNLGVESYRVSQHKYSEQTKKWFECEVNEPFYTLKEAKDYIKREEASHE